MSRQHNFSSLMSSLLIVFAHCTAYSEQAIQYLKTDEQAIQSLIINEQLGNTNVDHRRTGNAFLSTTFCSEEGDQTTRKLQSISRSKKNQRWCLFNSNKVTPSYPPHHVRHHPIHHTMFDIILSTTPCLTPTHPPPHHTWYIRSLHQLHFSVLLNTVMDSMKRGWILRDSHRESFHTKNF